MKKLVMLCAAAVATAAWSAPVATTGIPAIAYVQNGLVAQFDGIENAGAGLHDDAANTWTSLVGAFSLSIASGYENWSETAFELPSKGYKAIVSCTALTTASYVSFESCFAETSRTSTYPFLFGAGARAVWLYPSSSIGLANSKTYYQTSIANPFGAHTLYGAYDGATPTGCSLDGVALPLGSGNSSWTMQNYFTIGYPSNANWPFWGRYYAFRFYNRALTADETVWNAMLDRHRFLGAALDESVSLSDRKVEGGTVKIRIRAEADETRGTVTLNGGNADAWFAISSEAVTLTATPKPGWSFVEWKDDISALTSAERRSATVQVTAVGPRLLVAKFARTGAVDARSYIQDGLILHLDGIENAGLTDHDDRATIWADLSDNGNNATVYLSGRSGCWSGRSLVSSNRTNGVTADFVPSEAIRTLVNGNGPWTLETKCSPYEIANGSSPFGHSTKFAHMFINVDNNGYFRVREGNALTDAARDYVYVPDTTAHTLAGDGQLGRYLNGQLHNSAKAVLTGTKTLATSDRFTALGSMSGELFAVRLYDRALSAGELAYNAAIDKCRFEGVPFAGWTLGNGNVVSVKVTASCPTGSGTVSINGGAAAESVEATVAFGASVSVVFTPAAGCVCAGWANAPNGTDVSGATVTFAAGAPCGLFALTAPRNVHYVATTGADTNPGTGESPWRTIQHAVVNSAVKEFDEIRIAGGQYDESVVMSTTLARMKGKSRLTLKGSYAPDWTRDLKDHRTTLKASSRFAAALYCDMSFTNVVDGVDLTGGAFGFGFYDAINTTVMGKNYVSSGTFFRHCFITNNLRDGAACISMGYTLASTSGSGQPRQSCRFASCLLADNGGRGFSSRANDSQSGYKIFVNTTITRNAGGGVYGCGAYDHARFYFRNSIVSGNGDVCYQRNDDDESCVMNSLMQNSILWHGGDCFAKMPNSANVEARAPCLRDCFQFDPLLDETGRPTAASVANKSGMDVSDQEQGAISDDIYGNAWEPGAYDLGCFKTEYPRLATRFSADEVYVAKDGDDAADGTEAHPVATVAEGLWRTRPNGTCHVGPGTYTGVFDLGQEGVTLQGAGPDATVLCGWGTNGTGLATLHIAASNVTVVGCCLSNGLYGAINQNEGFCGTNIVFRDCAFAGNRIGFCNYRQAHDISGTAIKALNAAWAHWFTRCRFENNLFYGYHSLKRGIFDNCLACGNGKVGIYVDSHDTDSQSLILNCTVVDNGDWGVFVRNSLRPWLRIYNTVIAGNPRGFHPGNYTYTALKNSLLDNVANIPATDDDKKTQYIPDTTTCITDGTHAGFVLDDQRWRYRLESNSPCRKFGDLALYPIEGVSVTGKCDLAGVVRKTTSLDIGCYAYKSRYGFTLIVR